MNLEYEGIGDAFAETGTEGICWVLQKDTKRTDPHWRYEDQVPLQNGDHLTIYDREIFEIGQVKVVVWEGTVDFETKSHQETNEYAYTGQAIFGMWCHGLQKTRSPEQWALYFIRSYPMKLVRFDAPVIPPE